MKRFSLIAILAVSALIGFATISSAAPQGDFDGDGYPDIAVVQKLKKGPVRTRFIARMSSTGANYTYNFKLAGDAIITRVVNGRTYPGIVTVKSAKKPLIWSIYQPDGSIYSFQFGKPGAGIPAQGDWNGNGIGDCAMVTNGRWDIAIDCNPANVQSFFWGNAGETFRVYNDPVLNLAAAYVLRNVNGNLHWISRTLNGVTRNMGFGLATDIPVGVQAFNGTGTTRHLVVARRTNTGMVMYFGSAAGTITRNLGTNNGIPFVGATHLRGFYGIHDRSAGLTAVATLISEATLIQHGGSGFWFVAPDGTVYPVGVEASGIVGSGGSGGGGSGGGGGPPANFGSCTKWINVTDGHGKGFTWNNAASKGEKVILSTDYFQDYTVSSVKLYGPDGTLYRDVVYYGKEDSRDRWYVYDNKSKGTGIPKNAVLVINLINGPYNDLGPGPHCAHLPNPAQRYD
jgi:hypothetical protein